jgi:metal-responsive CopG/Arc/MetJ family transcriptional regulator
MPDSEDVTITISGVPEELLKKIDALAEEDDRSRSALVRRILEKAVEQREKQERAA